MRIGDTWGSIRGVLRNACSFAEIKDVVGAAGLPVFKLAHLQQKFSGGASKGQLMDAIDGLVNDMVDEDRDRFVVSCITEIININRNYSEELETVLNRVGWGISDSDLYPLRLQIDLDAFSFSEKIHLGVKNCLRRYKDGDYSGSISAICGVVDSLTEGIYEEYNLENHKLQKYQQRISKSFTESVA